MRTNIDIPDDLMAQAMRAGPFKTKKEAVEAGLRLLARQAAYREILALRGKLQWDDGPWPTVLAASQLQAAEPVAPYSAPDKAAPRATQNAAKKAPKKAAR